MSCLILKRSLIAAVITASTSVAYAANQTVAISGTLENWKSWNASASTTPFNMVYSSAKAGLDLFQALAPNASVGDYTGEFLNIPVTGTVTYDDATGVISALTLTQVGSVTGYLDVDADGLTDDSYANLGAGGAVTFSGLEWTIDGANLKQTAGTATGCDSGEPQCSFTVNGTNVNDHSNGVSQSIFDFQGVNSGYLTRPQSNAGQTGFGTSYKNWNAVPALTASLVNLSNGSVTLDVSSRVSSGASSTNAANTAQFLLTAVLPGNNCVAGTYFNGSGCTPAQAGYKVPTDLASSETACAAGTYQPNTGQSSCLDARAGKFAPTTALIIDVDCNPGSYQPNTGQSSCLEATAGNYVETSGATTQTACPDGTTSPAAATSAAQCVVVVVDTDGDTVPDSSDNCPSDINADQLDYDGDNEGNACDSTPYLKKSITSTSTKDGWILESTETSKKGGKLDSSATTLIVGDSSADQEYRSVLHFDTASLPDNAVIVKATLTLKKQSISGSVTPLGSLLADMKVNYFGSSSSLAISDFEFLAGKTSVATLKANGTSYSALLNSTGKAYIAKKSGGTTQFRLRFTKDDNDDKGNDYLKLYSGNAPSSSRPTLVIEYYVP